MIINDVKSLCHKAFLTLIGVIILVSLNSCSPPRPENEAIIDGKLEIKLIESRTEEPAKNVKVRVEKANNTKFLKRESDSKGEFRIPVVNSKSFPLNIVINDDRYIEKTIPMKFEDATNPIMLHLRETIISGGVMDMRDKLVLEECAISTNPSIGITTETDEDGKFELVSNNFSENTFYRIIVEHRDYESAEWTRIKPTINSRTRLGWKLLKLKPEFEFHLTDTLTSPETSIEDTSAVIFDK